MKNKVVFNPTSPDSTDQYDPRSRRIYLDSLIVFLRSLGFNAHEDSGHVEIDNVKFNTDLSSMNTHFYNSFNRAYKPRKKRSAILVAPNPLNGVAYIPVGKPINKDELILLIKKMILSSK